MAAEDRPHLRPAALLVDRRLAERLRDADHVGDEAAVAVPPTAAAAPDAGGDVPMPDPAGVPWAPGHGEGLGG